MAYQKSIVYHQDPLMEQYYIYDINTDLQRLLLNIDITMLESSDALWRHRWAERMHRNAVQTFPFVVIIG